MTMFDGILTLTGFLIGVVSGIVLCCDFGCPICKLMKQPNDPAGKEDRT